MFVPPMQQLLPFRNAPTNHQPSQINRQRGEGSVLPWLSSDELIAILMLNRISRTIGMELQNLSSNWRKLQKTLKKPDSASPPRQQQTLQRKRTDVNTPSLSARHDGVKRRKTQAPPATSLVKNRYNSKTGNPRLDKQVQRAVKCRKMSSTMEADGIDGGSALSAGGGAKLQAEGTSLEQVGVAAERINEGLSATYVTLHNYLFGYHAHH